MDTEGHAETEGDEPEGVSPKGTHVDPKPSGKGLKFVGETSLAVLTGEQEEGTLAAAQAPPPVPGCSKEAVMSEVKTLMEGFRKEFFRGWGAIKRTRDGEPNKSTAPWIYDRHKKSSLVPLRI